MNKMINKILLIITLGISPILSESTADFQKIPCSPLIDSLLTLINADSIWNRLEALTSIERYSRIPEAEEFVVYGENLFIEYGMDSIYRHTFDQSMTPNLVGVKEGTEIPDEHIVIGGHYDVFAQGYPGADDNGSGTAAVLEIARVLKGHAFKRTILFVLFSAEEGGKNGSKAYVPYLASQNVLVTKMLNIDAIAHLKGENDFDCSYNADSKELYDDIVDLCGTHVPAFSVVDASQKTYAKGSDHAAFWDAGIPAVYLADELSTLTLDFNPYWHTDQDVIGISANSKELAYTVTKVAAAALGKWGEFTGQTYNKKVYEKCFGNEKVIIKRGWSQITFDFSSIDNNREEQLSLYSSDGTVVRKMAVNGKGKVNLYTGDVAKGFYVLEIGAGPGKVVLPVLVQ